MSDSDKTNELDNYGVWVKKPPRTVSSEIGEENTDTVSDIDNDLPDFAAIDVVDDPMGGVDPNADDTTLSADELANITGASQFESVAEPEPQAASSSGTEEISLDEFIEGGVFEGDDNAAPASSEPKESAPAQQEESVSTADFLDSSDVTISDAPSVSESSGLSDDGPIDIDLSFDDSDLSPSMASSSDSSAPVKEVAGSEEVDLSDFGVDFGDGDSSSSSSSSAVSSDGTESVDLSDFGVDFGDGESSSEPAAPAAEPEPQLNEDGTENISLDSFGFDINAEEPSAEPAAQQESAPEEEVSPSLSDSEESPALSETESPSMSVAADDDIGDISIEAEPASTQESAPAQDFTSQDNDDFNVDSIMDSIEDENGNKSSLIDTPIDEPTESPEETIIEEPIVNDVVDMGEPVFEETAVDIPEDISTEPIANDDSDNPFSLPPDDAFTAVVTEEPTIHEDSNSLVDDISLDGNELDEEPVFEEPAEELPEESLPEENLSIEETASFEEPVAEEAPAFEEPAATEPDVSEPVKQDAEISSAANSILNQIASELSSLRNEISNLKSEFEELKNKEPVQTASPEPIVEETVPEEPAAESESSGGFFGAEDDDDTIALSLDEMDNILNTVELVEETAPTVPESASSDALISDTTTEEPAESLDFSNETIEEPVLDDIDTNIADEELPEEILVPKSDDDILVDSSDENLIEEEQEETISLEESGEELKINEPVEEDSGAEDINFEVESAEEPSEESSLVDEPFVFGDEEPAVEEADDSNDATLSADELANIAADSSASEEVVEEAVEEPAAPESNIPSVADILGDTSSDDSAEEESSGISISEGELDSLLSAEAALAEQNRKNFEAEENEEPVQSSIPNDLQKEIKSVLSYMDQLLENLPEEKIAEFAQSEQFETYKKLFKELGLD